MGVSLWVSGLRGAIGRRRAVGPLAGYLQVQAAKGYGAAHNPGGLPASHSAGGSTDRARYCGACGQRRRTACRRCLLSWQPCAAAGAAAMQRGRARAAGRRPHQRVRGGGRRSIGDVWPHLAARPSHVQASEAGAEGGAGCGGERFRLRRTRLLLPSTWSSQPALLGEGCEPRVPPVRNCPLA